MHWRRPSFAAALALGMALVPGGADLRGQVAAPARFVVVIDAAHGGDDTGSHLNDGKLEKNANLTLSVRLRSLLAARGIQVVTTREGDGALTPEQRAEIANHANAQACITLHAAESGFGVHLFISSVSPAQAAQFAPWKTAQAGYVTRSLALAGALNSALTQGGVNVTLGRTALPGLDSMTCPAVAVELGPQRDKDKKITAEPDDPDYQTQVAEILAAGLLEWRSEGRQR